MTRPIVIILEIIVLIFILRSPFAQYLLKDIQKNLSDWMVELYEYAEQQELAGLRQKIQPLTENMQPYQQNYIRDITSSKANLRHFYHAYCVAGDKNPYIYGASLRLMCEQIKSINLAPG